MAIYTAEQREVTGGFAKEIDQASQDMIFDNLQAYQYLYPERSTVRELVCNGLDSIKEKFIARAILSGEAKEEDYFLRRDDPKYKDSNFNPEYYDLQYLSSIDYVRIDYFEGPESQRDRIEITDYGVGLGGNRLAGYFNLGYSSKRNTKFALGKFGIGAKSALSTGVDCYYMESSYNGLLTKWNIYSASVNSLVPQLNLTTGQDNPTVMVGKHQVYAEVVPEGSIGNYTKLVIQVKKHKQQAYIDAVKSQLMYFDNIRFSIVDKEGNSTTIPTKAQILYENKHLVVAKDTLYNKPHIIINGVNYGLIDFRELELEDKRGNVGIKVEIEDVFIAPNRESVIWNDVTRKAILNRFNDAAEAATEMLNKKLKVNDYLEWQRGVIAARGRLHSTADNERDAMAVLAHIVDIEKLEFKFRGDEMLGMGERSTWGMRIDSYRLVKTTSYEGRKTITKTILDTSSRSHITDSIFGENEIILLTKEDSKDFRRVVRYLLSSQYSQVHAFICEENIPARTNPRGLPEGMNPADYPIYCGVSFISDLSTWVMSRTRVPSRILVSQMQQKVIGLLEESKLTVDWRDIQVPEDFVYNFKVNVDGKEEEEQVEEKPAPPRTMTPAELRALSNRVHMVTPYVYGASNYTTVQDSSVEPKVSEIQQWGKNGDITYYATKENGAILDLVACFLYALKENPIKDVHVHTKRHPNKVVVDDAPADYSPEEVADWMERREWLVNHFNTNNPFFFSAPDNVTSTEFLEYFTSPEIRLIRVAKSLINKLPSSCRPIAEFFYNIKNNQVIMSNSVANWYLARKARETLNATNNYATANTFWVNRIKQVYNELQKFVETYVDIDSRLKNDWKNHVVNFMASMYTFQEVVSSTSNPEELAAYTRTRFNNPNITGIVGFDLHIMNLIAELEEFHKQAGSVLNFIHWDSVELESLQNSPSVHVALDGFRSIGAVQGWNDWEFEPPHKVVVPALSTNELTQEKMEELIQPTLDRLDKETADIEHQMWTDFPKQENPEGLDHNTVL